MESRNAWMVSLASLWDSSSRSCRPSWINFVVVLSFHMLLMVLRTRFNSSVRRLLTANRNVGHFIWGVIIWNVIFEDDHTVCWSKISLWISLKLYTRKVIGMCLRCFPSSFERGAATPRLGDWVISATAAKIWLLISLWSFGFHALFSKGIASKVSPGKLFHSFSICGLMYLYTESGWML